MQSPNQAQNFSGGMMDGLGPKLEMLKGMPDQQLQQVAHDAQARNDITTLIACQQIDSERKNLRSNSQSQAPMQQPPVATQVANNIGKPPMQPPMQPQGQMPPPGGVAPHPGGMPPPGGMAPHPGGMPPPQGQPMMHAEGGLTQLPAGNIGMAGGGIVAFDHGGSIQDAGEGLGNPDFMSAAAITLGLEGGKTTDTGGVTNMGISQKAYPGMSADDINNLSTNDVLRKYKNDYWDKINGDALAKKDPGFATAAFDTAVNHGVSGAKSMVKDSGGDTSALLGLRQQKYDQLAQSNPEKYGQYHEGWGNRLAKLATALAPGQTAQAAEQAGPPAPTGIQQVAPQGLDMRSSTMSPAAAGRQARQKAMETATASPAASTSMVPSPEQQAYQDRYLRSSQIAPAANGSAARRQYINDPDTGDNTARLQATHPAAGGNPYPPMYGPDSKPPAPTADTPTADTDKKGMDPGADAANSGMFGLSKRELLLAGLAGLKNAGPHWQNMVGGMGEGLVQAKNEQAAQARAAYERQMGNKAESMGDYYRMRSEHPELFASGYYGAQGKVDGTQLKSLQTQQQAILAQMKDPMTALQPGAQQALQEQLRSITMQLQNVGSQHTPQDGTVSSAPSPGWGAAKPNS